MLRSIRFARVSASSNFVASHSEPQRSKIRLRAVSRRCHPNDLVNAQQRQSTQSATNVVAAVVAVVQVVAAADVDSVAVAVAAVADHAQTMEDVHSFQRKPQHPHPPHQVRQHHLSLMRQQVQPKVRVRQFSLDFSFLDRSN